MFGNYIDISRQDALSWAKWKIDNMPNVKTKEERLHIINSRLKGIKFDISDL